MESNSSPKTCQQRANKTHQRPPRTPADSPHCLSPCAGLDLSVPGFMSQLPMLPTGPQVGLRGRAIQTSTHLPPRNTPGRGVSIILFLCYLACQSMVHEKDWKYKCNYYLLLHDKKCPESGVWIAFVNSNPLACICLPSIPCVTQPRMLPPSWLLSPKPLHSILVFCAQNRGH